MNWEPNSWNDRAFTVAQGDGLFQHVDGTKVRGVLGGAVMPAVSQPPFHSFEIEAVAVCLVKSCVCTLLSPMAQPGIVRTLNGAHAIARALAACSSAAPVAVDVEVAGWRPGEGLPLAPPSRVISASVLKRGAPGVSAVLEGADVVAAALGPLLRDVRAPKVLHAAPFHAHALSRALSGEGGGAPPAGVLSHVEDVLDMAHWARPGAVHSLPALSRRMLQAAAVAATAASNAGAPPPSDSPLPAGLSPKGSLADVLAVAASAAAEGVPRQQPLPPPEPVDDVLGWGGGGVPVGLAFSELGARRVDGGSPTAAAILPPTGDGAPPPPLVAAAQHDIEILASDPITRAAWLAYCSRDAELVWWTWSWLQTSLTRVSWLPNPLFLAPGVMSNSTQGAALTQLDAYRALCSPLRGALFDAEARGVPLDVSAARAFVAEAEDAVAALAAAEEHAATAAAASVATNGSTAQGGGARAWDAGAMLLPWLDGSEGELQHGSGSSTGGAPPAPLAPIAAAAATRCVAPLVRALSSGSGTSPPPRLHASFSLNTAAGGVWATAFSPALPPWLFPSTNDVMPQHPAGREESTALRAAATRVRAALEGGWRTISAAPGRTLLLAHYTLPLELAIASQLSSSPRDVSAGAWLEDELDTLQQQQSLYSSGAGGSGAWAHAMAARMCIGMAMGGGARLPPSSPRAAPPPSPHAMAAHPLAGVSAQLTAALLLGELPPLEAHHTPLDAPALAMLRSLVGASARSRHAPRAPAPPPPDASLSPSEAFVAERLAAVWGVQPTWAAAAVEAWHATCASPRLRTSQRTTLSGAERFGRVFSLAGRSLSVPSLRSSLERCAAHPGDAERASALQRARRSALGTSMRASIADVSNAAFVAVSRDGGCGGFVPLLMLPPNHAAAALAGGRCEGGSGGSPLLVLEGPLKAAHAAAEVVRERLSRPFPVQAVAGGGGGGDGPLARSLSHSGAVGVRACTRLDELLGE